MDSFFLIDKPLGVTSFDIIRKLKRILHTSKIGHAGTLDPLASGLLLIAVGEYTKLLHFILLHDKEYEFTIHLDGESDSYDLGTPVRFISDEEQKRAKEHISLSLLQETISHSFIGKILQVPPKYSALKIDGEKSLFRAKAGEDFELKAREVEVFRFDILDFQYPILTCKAHVSSGTYIRSFAYDLGKKLGTGGYIGSLRRTKLGNIENTEAQSIEAFSAEKMIEETLIFPKDSFLSGLEEGIISRLMLGQRVRIEAHFPQNTPLFITKGKKIILVCNYDENILSPIRRLNIENDF